MAKAEDVLLPWYAEQRERHSRDVDIVGDFAGRELFVIHGESLIRHCLLDMKVDFDYGFQLLHAVYAVENFLANLSKRGCNFDIIFFENLEETCMPGVTKAENEFKYLLARKVLVLHLQRLDSENQVLEFESFESEACQTYFAKNAVHFVFCNEGEGEGEGPRIAQLRPLIWKLINHGTNVAIINSTTWKSSKVFAPLLCASKNSLPKLPCNYSLQGPRADGIGTGGAQRLEKIACYNFNTSDLSLREFVTVAACRSLLALCCPKPQVEGFQLQCLTALVLHTASLDVLSLGERACEQERFQHRGLMKSHSDFLSSLCSYYHALLAQLPQGEHDWDLYDLIDGRLFLSFLKRLEEGPDRGFPRNIVEKAQLLWSQIIHGFEDVPKTIQATVLSKHLSEMPDSQDPVRPGILAFNHPVLNDFLKDIEVDEVEPPTHSATDVVFEDLHHWHSSKRVVDWKRPAPGFHQRRRNQWQAAEIISYAASLTNSRGKVLDRETILVDTKKPQKGNSSRSQKPLTSKTKQGPKKGGKSNALKAAEQVQQNKALTKRDDMLRYWAISCEEFDKDPSLVSRYVKATRFLMSRLKDDYQLLLPDVAIYVCNVLGRIFSERRDGVDKKSRSGLYLISMIWKWLQELSTSRSCTLNVTKEVQTLTTRLKLPTLDIIIGEPSRPLPFDFHSKVTKLPSKLAPDTRVIQLEHGGPYMDRRFDSQPDSRVLFEPDAWQREVLDAIDSNESLLVVAPTSAGKTFISFYAMKKVLEESDDAVLVYVAPTKALVNQIAAEIEARFSKSYHGKEGKSVWAVHTRDYRINSPTGCQILVTVPQILQIMLLSPKNADRPNSWSRRVKRIVFDEVHCIGQAEDGVIWEQLLLLAPCPIVALSATIGNPHEFHDWLMRSQARKGHKMKMVVHGVRYSDLRKFSYEAPQDFKFRGLQKLLCLPVPGLDEGETNCPNFRFVHPVVALKNRNRQTLGDVSLEARDCFTLWKKMEKLCPSVCLSNDGALSPSKCLPETVSKADIMNWEQRLKAALRSIMELPDGSFSKLQASLKSMSGGESQRFGPLPDHIKTLFALACDLHAQDALPAIAFSYDRHDCEAAVEEVLKQLVSAEEKYKASDAKWLSSMREYKHWLKAKTTSQSDKASGKQKTNENPGSKFAQMREEADKETSPWESFDALASLPQFSFADTTMMQKAEFDDMVESLQRDKVQPWLIAALQRGLGVHHAGMNRRYRQIVEVMFRKGYLRLVVATGTLALGINMPCKTVIFSGDTVFLTAQNYRQASGRAGRRGFNLLGNVVFNGITEERVHEIMSSRLPDLRGQFPISASLVLRLLGLLHGTENSGFTCNIVQSLLSQTRVYLGGPDAMLSIKHHLRFSIEYLRRQNLLSAHGAPLNFAGLVGHLFFTENSVFAFHFLLKRGYFHNLCQDIWCRSEEVLLELMLVLSHLFSRVHIRRTKRLTERAYRSSSVVFLPRLPRVAEELLVQHNQETLSIFKGYVHSYVSQHLVDRPDRTLPFTKTVVGQDHKCQERLSGSKPTMLRSPFVALSGFNDDFETIHELCATVRDGVFLEESAIPSLPVWPHDTDTELNAYLYDFYKHGSLKTLVDDNNIKRGDAWFFLKDFSLTLATIVASLETFVKGSSMEDELDGGLGDEYNSDGELSFEDAEIEASEEPENPDTTALPIRGKSASKEVSDNWEDESSESESESEAERTSRGSTNSGYDGKGLLNVYNALSLLQKEFDAKFRKIWA